MMRRPRSGHGPIGIDLGPRSIAAVQLEGVRGRGRVRAAMLVERIEPESDPSPAELERLRGILDRQGFTGTDVVLALPRSAVSTASVEVPAAAAASRDSIARLELARAHRLDADRVEAAAWELPPLARSTGGAPVMIVGCPAEAADAWLDRFERAGLHVTALDVPMLAAARACAPLLEAGVGAAALLQVDWEAATILFVADGRIHSVRALPELGAGALMHDLANRLQIDVAAVGRGVRQTGVLPPPDGDGRGWLLDVRSALMTHIDSLLREVLASCSYVAARHALPAPQRLLLLGEGAAWPGLEDYIRATADLSVQIASLERMIDCPALRPDDRASAALTVALGLARHGADDTTPDISLIPAHRVVSRRRHRRAAAWAVSAAATIVVVSMAGLVSWSQRSGDVAEAEKERATVSAGLERDEASLRSIEAQLEQARRRDQVIRAIHDQPDWSLLLALLDRCLGTDVVLRSCQLAPSGSAPVQPGGLAVGSGAAPATDDRAPLLHLVGLAQSPPAVSQFLLRLEELGVFDRVMLSGSSREPFLTGEAVSFRITCALGAGEAMPPQARSEAGERRP
jgi:Tfp pilus assembly PilM family ATPase